MTLDYSEDWFDLTPDDENFFLNPNHNNDDDEFLELADVENILNTPDLEATVSPENSLSLDDTFQLTEFDIALIDEFITFPLEKPSEETLKNIELIHKFPKVKHPFTTKYNAYYKEYVIKHINEIDNATFVLLFQYLKSAEKTDILNHLKNIPALKNLKNFISQYPIKYHIESDQLRIMSEQIDHIIHELQMCSRTHHELIKTLLQKTGEGFKDLLNQHSEIFKEIFLEMTLEERTKIVKKMTVNEHKIHLQQIEPSLLQNIVDFISTCNEDRKMLTTVEEDRAQRSLNNLIGIKNILWVKPSASVAQVGQFSQKRKRKEEKKTSELPQSHKRIKLK